MSAALQQNFIQDAFKQQYQVDIFIVTGARLCGYVVNYDEHYLALSYRARSQNFDIPMRDSTIVTLFHIMSMKRTSNRHPRRHSYDD